MVGADMLKGLEYVFYMALIGVILIAIVAIYGGYKLFNHYYGEEVITSSKRINPELQLIVKDNKVDTLFVYKLKK